MVDGDPPHPTALGAVRRRPSKISAHLSFRWIAISTACSGDAVHSSTFFAQYMRMKPCILPW